MELLNTSEFVTTSGTKFIVSDIPAYYAHDVYGALVDASKEYGRLAHCSLPLHTVLIIMRFVKYYKAENETCAIDSEARFNEAFKNKKDEIEVLRKMIEKNFDFFLDGTLLSLLLPENQ